MAAQTKIELILELKNKVKSGLSEARAKIGSEVGTMKAKLAELKSSFASNFKNMAEEVPMLGGAIKALVNPITLVTAGVAALLKGFNATTKAAADFTSQFRGLNNLNLDKTAQEISKLRKDVLDTAFTKGFDTEKTIAGYFDVQSTTGKYGDEVRKIVSKQGEFAKLMQADFNNYIAGTAKAMANFGFDASQLDDFNRSAYATMKVGVTTFDELAKVQSVYSGAAASAKQTYDTANKLFALFTIKTKSVDVAATLTKSMFNDLTKAATIDAFEGVGMSMYETNGQLKQADKLLLELNKKFQGLSDDKIVALKNQFKGSEGIIALIQAATDQSGQLQSTLEGFDSTKFGLNDALEIAKNDLNYINEQLQMKKKVALIEIGDAMLPLKIILADFEITAINKLAWLFRGDEGNKERQYNSGIDSAEKIYGHYQSDIASMSEEKLKGVLEILKESRASTQTSKANDNSPSSWFMDRYYDGQLDYIKNLQNKLPTLWSESKYGNSISKWESTASLTPMQPSYPTEHGLTYYKDGKGAGVKWNYDEGSKAAEAELAYLKNNLSSVTKEQFEEIYQSISQGTQSALAEYKLKKEEDPYYASYVKGWAIFRQDFLQNLRTTWGGLTNYGDNIFSGTSALTTGGDLPDDPPPAGNLSESVTSVTGSAKQIRNITVNIEAFNKGGINTQNTNLQQMDSKQIEEWFIDVCMRAIRNVELSY